MSLVPSMGQQQDKVSLAAIRAIEIIAEQAIEIIAERGWTQGFGRSPKVCLVDALNQASQDYPTFLKAMKITEKVLGLDASSLTTWNDEPTRRVEDVISILKRVQNGEGRYAIT